MEALENAGHLGKVDVGLDVAASEFCTNTDGVFTYDFGAKAMKPRVLDTNGCIDLFAQMCKDYPIATIEDPFDQDDTKAWIAMQEKLGG